MTEIEAKLNWRDWEVEICVDDAYFRYVGDSKESAEAGTKQIYERMLDAFSDKETLPLEQQSDICKYACSVALNAGKIMRVLAALYENQKRRMSI